MKTNTDLALEAKLAELRKILRKAKRLQKRTKTGWSQIEAIENQITRLTKFQNP